MPTVRLSFTPDPAYVRTVRTVAVAMARRAGVADELLDEVRLAIGEACARAVAVHRRERRADPIEVAMIDDPSTERGRGARPESAERGPGGGGRFTVRVTDRCSPEAARKELAGGGSDIVARATVVSSGEDTGRGLIDEDALALDVGLALLAGLVADFAVEDALGHDGTQVRMSWPLARHAG
jgi:anti-sigma regulatory factor (Ser/Thr protein kinase)